MPHKPATTSVPIAALLAERWSPYAIDPQRAVSHEQVTALLEAARWAPSCFGDQPWRYLVWNRSTDLSGWEKAFACLMEGNQVWVKNAPLLLLAVATPTFSFNGEANRWAQYDTGAASENICLQANALGLVAHQMGGFDPDKAKASFNIPADHTCMSMIAIGYPGTVEQLPEAVRAKQQAPRQRKPLTEIAFAGTWGQSIR